MCKSFLTSFAALLLALAATACGGLGESTINEDGDEPENPSDVTGGDSFTCDMAKGMPEGCRGNDNLDCENFCHPQNPDQCIPRDAYLDLCGETAEDGPGDGDDDDEIITCSPDDVGCVTIDPDGEDDVDDDNDGNVDESDEGGSIICLDGATGGATCEDDDLGESGPENPEGCLALLLGMGVPYSQSAVDTFCDSDDTIIWSCTDPDDLSTCSFGGSFSPANCRDCLAQVRTAAVSGNLYVGECPDQIATAIGTANGMSFRDDYGDTGPGSGTTNYADVFYDVPGDGPITPVDGLDGWAEEAWAGYSYALDDANWVDDQGVSIGAPRSCPVSRADTLVGMSDPGWTGDDEWHETLCADTCDSLPDGDADGGALGGFFNPSVGEEWVYASYGQGGVYILHEVSELKMTWNGHYADIQGAITVLNRGACDDPGDQNGQDCCETTCVTEQEGIIETAATEMAQWFVHPDQEMEAPGGLSDVQPAIPTATPEGISGVVAEQRAAKNWMSVQQQVMDYPLGGADFELDLTGASALAGGFALVHGTSLLLAAPFSEVIAWAAPESDGPEAGRARMKKP